MVQPREFVGEEVHGALSVLADIGGGKVDSHRSGESGELSCEVIAYEANNKISSETEVAQFVFELNIEGLHSDSDVSSTV